MLKDLLVYLDGRSEDETRIAYAEALAQANDAHLTGLFCNVIPEMLIAGDTAYGAPQVMAEMQEQANAAGDEKMEELKARFERLAVPNELRRLDLFSAQIGNALSEEARMADMFIASRPYDENQASTDALETVMFDSGRSCIFLPPKAKAKPVETVVVAWRNTREAARALAESLPLLAKAKKVIIATVQDSNVGQADTDMPAADIARHLDRHGISVDISLLRGVTDIAEALRTEAENAGADLVVMGGYGHSRFREWVLGGVTRDTLRLTPIPVLIAH